LRNRNTYKRRWERSRSKVSDSQAQNLLSLKISGKAVAAAAFGISTRDMVERASVNPAFWSALPSLVNGVLPTTGAVPIKLNGHVVGAIGCGGGTPDQDHECAQAGAAAFAELAVG